MRTQLSFSGTYQMFKVQHPIPQVYHITDAMGVCFTLIEGDSKAILFDTGYGTEDVNAFVRTLTDKPVSVFLSHGHHDHMLGARWFDNTWLCEEDMEEFRERTGEDQRIKVSRQAAGQGVPLPDDFMTAMIRMPRPIRFTEKTGPYDSTEQDLGGIIVKVIHVPGHTPGSIVLFIPQESILLTGDDWNPCTWMWFPTSVAADVWRERMKTLVRTLETNFGSEIKKVICSHQPMAREGAELKKFLNYMTDERIEAAPAVDMGAPIDTHQIVKGEWTLIFDRAKIKG